MSKPSDQESAGRRRLFKGLNVFYWISMIMEFPWSLVGNQTIDEAATTNKGRRSATVVLIIMVVSVAVLMGLLLLWAFLL